MSLSLVNDRRPLPRRPPACRVLIPSSLPEGPQTSLLALTGESMGTTWHLVLADPRIEADRLLEIVTAELAEIGREVDPWNSDSHLSLFNRAPAGSWTVFPDSMFMMLQNALALARETGGRYDPTIGRLVDLWGFGPSGPRTAPPQIGEFPLVPLGDGWQRLKLDLVRKEVLQPGGIMLDLSSLARGQAVDRLSAALTREGAPNHFIDLGGELIARGTAAEGGAWWVEVEQPAGLDAPQTLLALSGHALAISGRHRRAYQHGGSTYCHALDGRTGRPVRHDLAMVAVIAEGAMEADALSTALFIMGLEDGSAFAEHNGIAAAFHVLDDEPEHLTTVWAAMERRVTAAFLNDIRPANTARPAAL
jgi:thiamine biosynthesis lipoprotein